VINHYPGKKPEEVAQETYRYSRFLGPGVDYREFSFEEFATDPIAVIGP
jgi:hypothetical protein